MFARPELLLTLLLSVSSSAVQATGQDTFRETASFGTESFSEGSSTMTAVNDLGTGSYTPSVNSSGALCNGSNGCNAVSFQGGLYPSGLNIAPAAHDADGRTLAADIHSAQTSTSPAVLLCVGFSNLKSECGQMISDYKKNTETNQTSLKVLNAGQSGAEVCDWTLATGIPTCTIPGGAKAFNAYDTAKQSTLVPAKVTESQVTVLLAKMADQFAEQSSTYSNTLPCTGNGTPSGTYFLYGKSATPQPCTTQAEAYYFESQLGKMVRAAKQRYSNLKQIFFYSRIYGGYATAALPSLPGGNCGKVQCAAVPERYSYEEGFGVKWLIAAQITQCPNPVVGTTNTCSSAAGDSFAGSLSYGNGATDCSGGPCGVWIGWASYVWANGTTQRIDGLDWCNGQTAAPCSGEKDFQSDGSHPSVTVGEEKVASCTDTWGECIFFLNSAYTSPWFHK